MADKTGLIQNNILERNCIKSATTQVTISSQGYVVNISKVHKLQLEIIFAHISERIKLFKDKEVFNARMSYNKVLKV